MTVHHPRFVRPSGDSHTTGVVAHDHERDCQPPDRPTLCLHRKAQDSRWNGRQDLFCKRPLGHEGNHLHDRHPDGSTFTGFL